MVARAGGQRRIDRSCSARIDSLRVFWYRRIVNFDSRTQEEALRAVKSATQESGRRVRAALEDALARLKAWLAEPWDLRRLLQLAGGAAAAAALAWLLRNARLAWRDRGMFWRWRTAPDPVRREAGRWLCRLQGLPVETALRADLERLRYGPLAGRPPLAPVVRRARQVWRARHEARITPENLRRWRGPERPAFSPTTA